MRNLKILFLALLVLAISVSVGWALEGDSNITRIIPESYEVPVEIYTDGNTANTLLDTETGLSLTDCGAATCRPVYGGGVVINCSKHTLPTAVAGYEYTFTAGSNQCYMTVDVASTDTILYSVSSVGLDAADSIKSTGQAGDSVTLYSPAATYWTVKQMKGTWTDNGTS